MLPLFSAVQEQKRLRKPLAASPDFHSMLVKVTAGLTDLDKLVPLDQSVKLVGAVLDHIRSSSARAQDFDTELHAGALMSSEDALRNAVAELQPVCQGAQEGKSWYHAFKGKTFDDLLKVHGKAFLDADMPSLLQKTTACETALKVVEESRSLAGAEVVCALHDEASACQVKALVTMKSHELLFALQQPVEAGNRKARMDTIQKR